MYKLKDIALILLLGLCLVVCCHVKTHAGGVDSTVLEKGIVIVSVENKDTVHNGEIVSLGYRITNHSNAVFTGIVRLSEVAGITSLSRSSHMISLKAGETYFWDPKVRVDKYLKAQKLPVSLSVIDYYRIEAARLVDTLIIPRKENLRLQTPSAFLFRKNADTTIQVPITIENRGNVNSSVRIIIALSYKNRSGSNPSWHFSLPAFRDTTLYYKLHLNKRLRQYHDLNLNVTGLAEDGAIWGSNIILLNTLSSKGVFSQDDNTTGKANNLTVGVQNIGKQSENYFVQNNAAFEIGNSKLEYNFNFYLWNRGEKSAWLNNAWLKYQYKNAGVQVGNIYRNFDVNINGNGGVLFLDFDSRENKSIELGYLDKRANLFQTGRFAASGWGRSAWSSFKWSNDTGLFTQQVMLDEDKIQNAQSALSMSRYRRRFGKNWLMEVVADWGLTRNMFDYSETHLVYLGSASLSGKIGDRLFFSTLNTLSSAYFPGSRKGVIGSSDQLSYRLNKRIETSLGVNIYQSDPRYFRENPLLGYNYHSLTNNYFWQVGINMGQFYWLLSPVYYYERGNYYSAQAGGDQQFYAPRVLTSLSWHSFMGRQNINLQFWAGKYRIPSIGDGNNMMFSGNVSLSDFRFTGSYQRGPKMLADAIFAGADPDVLKGYERLIVGPSYLKSFNAGQLTVEASVNYYKDQFVNSITNYGRISYIWGKTTFNLSGQYFWVGSSVTSSYFMASATHNFGNGSIQLKHKGGTLELQLFYDNNSNGIRDSTEQTAPDIVLNVDNQPFITSSKGKAVLQNVDEGQHKIHIVGQNGWFADDITATVSKGKKVALEIPLHQTGLIYGSVSLYKDSLLGMDVSMELGNKVVVAIGEDGTVVARTHTDDNGNYFLYVPEGQYVISLAGLPRQIDIEDAYSKKVNIEKGASFNYPTIILKVRNKKVEIKKFGK